MTTGQIARYKTGQIKSSRQPELFFLTAHHENDTFVSLKKGGNVMATSTLRNWGGAVAVSLPKKVLSLVGLQSGAKVDIAVENGKVILTPSKPRYTLDQLLKEQVQLERKIGRRICDPEFLADEPVGAEIL